MNLLLALSPPPFQRLQLNLPLCFTQIHLKIVASIYIYIYIHTHTYTYAAAAAAVSLQSCLTLCDPIDGSPPGSPVLGILQARTLEWVAISFSNA